jgi:hypothetical protein
MATVPTSKHSAPVYAEVRARVECPGGASDLANSRCYVAFVVSSNSKANPNVTRHPFCFWNGGSSSKSDFSLQEAQHHAQLHLSFKKGEVDMVARLDGHLHFFEMI